MATPQRVSAADVRRKQSTEDLLLVCAYDSDEKFRENHLDGAVSLRDFRSREHTLSKDQEIAFYCA